MSEEQSDNALAKHLKTSPVYIYTVILVMLYGWGYWGVFNINILEYASFSDLLRMAIYPLLSALILFLVFVIGQINWGQFKKSGTTKTQAEVRKEEQDSAVEKNIQPINEIIQKLNRLLCRIKPRLLGEIIAGTIRCILWMILKLLQIILWIYNFIAKHDTAFGILMSFILLALACKQNDYYLYGASMAPPFWIAANLITQHTKCLGGIADHRIRNIAIFILLIFPAYGWLRGVHNGRDITNGIDYQYMLASQIPNSAEIVGTNSLEQLRYIGRTTDYVFFFYAFANQTVSARAEAIDLMSLSRHQEPSTSKKEVQ